MQLLTQKLKQRFETVGRQESVNPIIIVGIFDPTGAADAANAVLQAKNKQWFGMAVSIVGVIPYVGDVAKVAKVGKNIKIIKKAIQTVKGFAKNSKVVDDGVKLLGRGVEASWGKAFNYRHGGQMTAIEHIVYRHAHNTGFANVSKFAKGTNAKMIKKYVDEAVKYGKEIDGGFEYNFGKIIGVGKNGAGASSIRVFIKDGWVRTAYPF